MTPPGRGQFHAFFARKHLALLKAAFDPGQRRPDYAKAETFEGIAAQYRALDYPKIGPDFTARHIFMLWQQGWESAPPLVRACAESWERQNPGWTVHRLDAQSLAEWAPALADYHLPAASRPAQSDIARLELLRAHGGIWADATLFCARPLDDWLPAGIADAPVIFTWPRPYRLVDVWFMAASPGDPIIAALGNDVRHYWRLFRRPHHYYWLPYLLEFLFERRPDLATRFVAAPHLPALGPLAVGGKAFDPSAPQSLFALIDSEMIPAHKLSHKWRFDGPLAGTALGRLTGLDRL